jgi:hypothetical protein
MQSYQQVFRVLKEDLIELKSKGVSNLNKFKIGESFYDYQRYIFSMKQVWPEKYERISFDFNGHEPFSKDLASIIFDFKLCGYLDYENNIILE